MNDSIVFDGTITQEPQRIEVKRFAEETSLLIVNKATEQVVVFELPNDGGTFSFERNDEEISMRE